ncbi:NAD(P)H-binding protein [Streptomyces sp. M10(2022)]
MRDHPWRSEVEVAKGDVTDPATLTDAMSGIDVAYYLVHALGAGARFEDTDRRAAHNFAESARAAGVRRIVYLGGLTPVGLPGTSFRRTCAPAPRWARSFWTGRCPRRCCARP